MRDAGRIGFDIKGEYDNAVTYEFLDVVYYDYSSYVAKKETSGNPPVENNEYWQILAKGQLFGVSGVKGDKETNYRVGDVNITAENVGALPITGGTVEGTANPLIKLKRENGNFTGIQFENQYGHIFNIEGYRGESGTDKQLNIFANDWNLSLLRINDRARVIYDYKTKTEKTILVDGDDIGNCIVNGKKLSEWLK